MSTPTTFWRLAGLTYVQVWCRRLYLDLLFLKFLVARAVVALHKSGTVLEMPMTNGVSL